MAVVSTACTACISYQYCHSLPSLAAFSRFELSVRAEQNLGEPQSKVVRQHHDIEADKMICILSSWLLKAFRGPIKRYTLCMTAYCGQMRKTTLYIHEDKVSHLHRAVLHLKQVTWAMGLLAPSQTAQDTDHDVSRGSEYRA